MASRGAKNLILLSRSDAQSEAAVSLLAELESLGVRVESSPCDITNSDSLRTTLARCATTMPPVRGCLQASMVLRDSIFENMTFEDWNLAIGAKVRGTLHLYTHLPQAMDFFVCFSSVTGIIGSGGTANYAAGNTYMDAFVRYRIEQGEKAVSLSLGWIASEGYVAENSSLQSSMAAGGFLKPIAQDEFHVLLDYYCNPDLTLPTPSACQPIIGLELPAALRAKGLTEPPWMQYTIFRHLQHMALDGPLLIQSESVINYAALFRNASSVEEQAQVVTESLIAKLSKALSVPLEDIDPN